MKKNKLSLLASLFAIGYIASSAFSQTSSWKDIEGPTCRLVHCLTVDSQNNLFAGSPCYGLFRSKDYGNSWVLSDTGITSDQVFSSTCNYKTHEVFVGTWKGGVHLSTDSTVAWRNVGLDEQAIRAIVIDTLNNHIIAAAWGSGIFRLDSNQTSSKLNRGLTDSNVVSLTVSSYGFLWAGTEGGGIFRSEDKGESWIQVNSGLTNLFVWSLAIAPDGDIFAGTWGGGVFRSTDNGDHWYSAGQELKNRAIYCLTINKEGEILAGTIKGEIFRSRDQGETWLLLKNASPNTNIYSLATTSNGYIFAASNQGVFRSTDNGLTWEKMNHGLEHVTKISSIHLSLSGQLLAGTNRHGLFASNDDGENWVQASGTNMINSEIKTVVTNRKNQVYTAESNEIIFRTDGIMEDWRSIAFHLSDIDQTSLKQRFPAIRTDTSRSNYDSQPLRPNRRPSMTVQEDLSTRDAPILQLAYNSLGEIFALTQYAGLFLSVDDGKVWKRVDAIGGAQSIAISPNGGIFVGTEEQRVFRSFDNGRRWRSSRLDTATTWKQTFAINSLDHIWVGTISGDLFRSVDHGVSWKRIVRTLESGGINALAFDFQDRLWVGSDGRGVFYLQERGGVLHEMNEGLTDFQVLCLVTNHKKKFILALTESGLFSMAY